MLFTGSAAAAPKKKEDKRREKPERDEKYDLQENVFLRWLAIIIPDEAPKEVKELAEPNLAAKAIARITGKPPVQPGSRYEFFQGIIGELGDFGTKLTPSELSEHSQKAVLQLWWCILHLYWRRMAPEPLNGQKVQEALRGWCMDVCARYPEVAVVDFTSSWRDGHAFNVLLHNFDHKLVKMAEIADMSALERLEHAFAAAERLGVPRLLTGKAIYQQPRRAICRKDIPVDNFAGAYCGAEELAREFDACLEQVLAWLLEAEEECAVLSDVETHDLTAVKARFRDYETFMASLTESQDTVGRVLHRGQLLCQKSETEEERNGIQDQLELVNSRWESLRALAMERQSVLQNALTGLQQKQLNEICGWLADTETLIKAAGPLGKPRIWRCASSFVAVVDEAEAENGEMSVTQLENTLRSVGQRWEAICTWAETRAQHLDGLSELISTADDTFDKLHTWIEEREKHLMRLKSAHHLEGPDEVAEQVELLQQAEAALEAEHPSFVKASQLSCELVARLEGKAGEEGQKSLDRPEKKRKVASEESEPPKKAKEAEEAQAEAEHLAEPAEEDKETAAEVLKKFVEHVERVGAEMRPLHEWCQNFSLSRRPAEARKMIQVCQGKLVEIKEQEGRVNRLQLEMERIHRNPTLSAKQLKTANDAFAEFAKDWAEIVTKISEALNVLSGHSDQDEEAVVARGIEQWIEGCDRVLNEMGKASVSERALRAKRIKEQWDLQNANLTFIQKDHLKRAILTKGLQLVGKRLQQHIAFPSTPTSSVMHTSSVRGDTDDIIQKIETALNGPWQSVGIISKLREDLGRIEKILETCRTESLPTVTVWRERCVKLSTDWTTLSDSLEDTLSCVKREQKKSVQKAIDEGDRLLETLEKTLEESESAADAESLSEHLDQIESLLEQVPDTSRLEPVVDAIDENFVRDSWQRHSASRDKISQRAKERLQQIAENVKQCERMDEIAADLDRWMPRFCGLLAARKGADISALDVPEEYKKHFSDVSVRFAEFRQPVHFEGRLEKCVDQLATIEQSIDEMTGIKLVALDNGYLEAKAVAKKLVTIDEDLKDLEGGREKLMADGILDRKEAAEIRDKIHGARRKTKELGLRAEEAVDRLDDCRILAEKLKNETKTVDRVLESLETRLEEYGRQESLLDEEKIEQMVNEWNRNESLLLSLEELERVLKAKAVDLDTRASSGERRRRAQELKTRLDAWNLTAREMNDDGDELLLEVDELHEDLLRKLDEVEAEDDPKEVSISIFSLSCS
ncbi:unnamed protein product, partial [Mesorhabditis spiculigera]